MLRVEKDKVDMINSGEIVQATVQKYSQCKISKVR